MGEKPHHDLEKVFDTSDSEAFSRQSSLRSLRLASLPKIDSITGTFTFCSSQHHRAQASDSSKDADPWAVYKEKLEREIALDSQRLVRLKESANSVKSGKSSNPSMSLREYNSDVMMLGDLEEEEEGKESRRGREVSSGHKPKHSEVSEGDLETAKFQDISTLPERYPSPPQPIVRTDLADHSPEPVAETPQQPGEPIVNRLQRTFKVSHRIPKKLLAGQTLDGLRHIIEILISDKQNLQDQLSSAEPQEKKLSSAEEEEEEEEEEDLRLAGVASTMSPTPNHSFTTAQSTSIMRQRMFPVRNQGNQEELMMRRTNNQSTYQRPPRRVREAALAEEETEGTAQKAEVPKSITTNMKMFDTYEAELIRLTTEAEDLKAKNALLTQVLRLSPEKRRVSEISSQMQARLEQQSAVIRTLMDENAALKAKLQVAGQSSCTPSRAASPAGSAFQGASQFFPYDTEPQSSVRRVSRPVAMLKELVPDEEPLNLRPEEYEPLQNLINLHAAGDEKRFEDYLGALLAKRDNIEFASLLIKYTRYLEEDVFFGLRKQVLELRTKAITQDAMYQDAVSEKVKVDVEVKELRSSLDQLRYELDRVNTRLQVELRHSPIAAKPLAATRTQPASPLSLYVTSITKGGSNPLKSSTLKRQ